MNDAWEDRKRAQEEKYFDEQNKAALARLKSRSENKVRLSPITGKPMVQKTISGVVADVCEESGGIFLDKGELEQIIKNLGPQSEKSGFLSDFLKNLIPK